jgi:hypothetical protein
MKVHSWQILDSLASTLNPPICSLKKLLKYAQNSDFPDLGIRQPDSQVFRKVPIPAQLWPKTPEIGA